MNPNNFSRVSFKSMPSSTPKVLVILTLLVALMSSATATAQDPYSPRKANAPGLITNGIFKQSPLAFPFNEESVRNITPESTKAGDDFEHIYNISYREMVDHFTNKDNIKKGFDIIDPRVFPEGGGKIYYIKGIQEIDGGSATRLRFANANVSRDFSVTLYPDGGNTRVIFHNMVLTTISSGVMPARKGFVGHYFEEELPFNWN